MNNLGGGWPGAVSFAGLGQPGRYGLCLAERADVAPWLPLHVELGYRAEQSTVTVLRAETVINVTGGLDELASVMGSAASLFGILHSGKAGVILSPFTARRLASEGRTRADVRRELFARGRAGGLDPGGARAGRHHARRGGGRSAHPPARLLPVVGPPAMPGDPRDRVPADWAARRAEGPGRPSDATRGTSCP